MILKQPRHILLAISCFFLFFLLLLNPAEGVQLSFHGLQLWFQHMIPSLLPFMILSSMMIRLDLTGCLTTLAAPWIRPLMKINPPGIYVILMGFLCGFPMGAKLTAELYGRQKLSRQEASFLLAFCNNIGPAYVTGFVLPTLGLKHTLPYLFAMYGIPFCYGILLRHTLYRNAFSYELPTHTLSLPHKKKKNSFLRAAESSGFYPILDAIDDAILSSLFHIARLGGYMIFFDILNLIPQTLLSHIQIHGIGLPVFTSGLLEINSGISSLGSRLPLAILLLLPFGGFSCLSQTYCMIRDTDLSLCHYLLHKILLTILTLLYYTLWYLFFPASFLQ